MIEHLTAHEPGGHARRIRECLARKLEGYNVWGQIEGGSQGLVFYAYHEMSQRSAAIKVLLDGPLASDEQEHRFRREIELISKLNHPNIVALYDCGVVDGRLYYTMEYIEGVSITDHMLVTSPTIQQCVELFIKTCEGLSHAHKRGVIHRDLKPTNILVDRVGNPKLVDFGLAKDVASSKGFETSVGRTVGTLYYLSPEQAAEEDQSTGDVYSDIYSLGVVMFEVLSGGVLPYPVDGSIGQVRQNILHREPQSLRMAVEHPASIGSYTKSDIHPDLASIVAKTLRKEPRLRYRSVDELADDLKNYLTGQAVQARSGYGLYSFRKRVRRYWVQFTIAALLFAVVVSLWLKADAERRALQVAQSAEAALQIGAFLRLGSFERDSGRLESAAEILKIALRVGEGQTLRDDPSVQKQLFKAYQQLAEMYYDGKQPDEANLYAELAEGFAQRLVASDPADPERQRIAGFAHVLRGRRCMATEQFDLATEALDRAINTREQLLATDPTNESLLAEQAFAHALQGYCFRQLRDYPAALCHYTAGYDIRGSLYETDPTDSRVIELMQSELSLAAWHINQKTEQDNQQASQWLQTAQNRLASFRQAGRLGSRELDAEQIESAIEANMRILAKR